MNHTNRIIKSLSENKKAVKLYVAYDKADQVGKEAAEMACKYFGVDESVTLPPTYIVVYIPTVQKYAIIFQLSQWMTSNRLGGYLGYFAEKGHYAI